MEWPAPHRSTSASSLRMPRGSCQSVTTGRTALALIARAAAAERRNGPALVPAYICPAVVQALRSAGRTVRFYPVDRSLTPDEAALARLAERHAPALVVVAHYFGFPAAGAVFDTLTRFRDRCWVVEDCAHGSWIEGPSAPVGRQGDFVLTSFRKYLPLADGGWLLNRTGAELPELPPAETPFVRMRIAAKALSAEYRAGRLGEEAEARYLDLFARAEHQVDTHVSMLGMSAASRRILAMCDVGRAMRRRRRNFARVIEYVGRRSIATVASPLFDRLPAGVSPLAVPLRVRRRTRDRLRAALAARRVFCPVHWPRLPAGVRGREFGAALETADEILGLPIDQRYGDAQIDQMLTRLSAACREVR
jgi:dTDP-4-amino-4,6-dideoxygalactose transaminase